jgi:hypothetical protein
MSQLIPSESNILYDLVVRDQTFSIFIPSAMSGGISILARFRSPLTDNRVQAGKVPCVN